MKLMVTGGSGFIGSAVVRSCIGKGWEIVNVDKLTYAASENSLAPVANNASYHFVNADICNAEALRDTLINHSPDAIIHLAAESHVDRSIDGPAEFIQTNIVGTYNLLQVALEYFKSLSGEKKKRFRFHHVSTDEVFGSLNIDDPPFKATTPYMPKSPYSASKAASDHLALAWFHTFNLPVVVSQCSNNYGPYQFPDKLIPLMIVNALQRHPLPIYGKGTNIRDWIYVNDHVGALLAILEKGKIGCRYLISGKAERSNLEVVKSICFLLDEIVGGPAHEKLITFVDDRPGHDFRYALDDSIVRDELGWQPSVDFNKGLRRTLEWYLGNKDWWLPLLKERYDGNRLGIGS